jgi:hypothetical protein
MSSSLEPKDCIQPLLGLVGSGFLGFLWFLSTIVATGTALRKLSVATHGIFATVTMLGGVFFTKWNASVGPTNGLFWVAGTVIGFWCAYRYVTDAVVQKVVAQSGHNDRVKVWSLVKGTLLRDGARVAEQEALECVRKLQNPDRELSRRSMAQLHRFVHEARDSAAREFAKIGKNLAATGKFEPDLSAYLEVVVGLYREMLGDLIDRGTELWVALRRLNPDGTYATIIRKGYVDDSARSQGSEPVPAGKGLPKMLEENLKSGDLETRGVLFLSPQDRRKKARWQSTQNDKRKEDLFVMAAPVTIRRVAPDGKALHREMAMILYANHKNNVFAPWLCDIVRCCVDTVSTALSVGIQLGEGLKHAGDSGAPGAAATSGALVASGAGAQVTGESADTHGKDGPSEERADASKTG